MRGDWANSLTMQMSRLTVATDAHPQILALMKHTEKNICLAGHQIDVWHGSRIASPSYPGYLNLHNHV